mmetsp:Transcript_28543/g.20625  ORF Transcript_28543/g.20625 Transcript_28543/m.20625 type:complete len:137 (+) Transcript_28543:1004-1414(+)
MWTHQETNIWIYASVCLVIMSLTAWVRQIAKFSFAFLLGNVLLLLVYIVISSFSINQLNNYGVQQGVEAINEDSYLVTLGFMIYCFEGIGVVMPIMQTCAEPKKFPKILTAAILTLVFVYISYGLIVYSAYGTDID